MKLIAFYLPQFHAIPENDQWWGKGFTEWTNTRKAKPLFKGHYQPRSPLNGYYYNLLDKKTLQWQVELAQKYGVWGFCFYHYWFKGGKKLLEQPIELFLKNKDINQNFCLCWANENWTRCWDGHDKEVLMEQDYGNEDEWKNHFSYLLPFFKDSRYITQDGKPVFVVYKPNLIPDFNAMVDFWNEQATRNGLNGIVIMSQSPNASEKLSIDYRILFEPMHTLRNDQISKKNAFSMITKTPGLVIAYFAKKFISKFTAEHRLEKARLRCHSFDAVWKLIVSRHYFKRDIIPGAFVDWDNTARRGPEGMLFKGSTPKKFGKYLSKLIRRVKKESSANFLFLTAWNEWAEGSYLEPDEKHQYEYLQATRDALIDNGDFPVI
jgi:hypothetical protein